MRVRRLLGEGRGMLPDSCGLPPTLNGLVTDTLINTGAGQTLM